jgi:hypothetical protein
MHHRRQQELAGAQVRLEPLDAVVLGMGGAVAREVQFLDDEKGVVALLIFEK